MPPTHSGVSRLFYMYIVLYCVCSCLSICLSVPIHLSSTQLTSTRTEAMGSHGTPVPGYNPLTERIEVSRWSNIGMGGTLMVSWIYRAVLAHRSSTWLTTINYTILIHRSWPFSSINHEIAIKHKRAINNDGYFTMNYPFINHSLITV